MEKSTPPIGVLNVATTPTAHAAARIERFCAWFTCAPIIGGKKPFECVGKRLSNVSGKDF
eukprot:2155930-Pleurochrysis_carterae.AAC.1